jgi:uncharacterized RDD family membrane protein YckC
VLDGLLLGIIGALAGIPLFDWFASLGAGGRLIGFGVALLYFGIFNSAIGGGRTLGKRIMSIEVVDLSGRHISFLRSALRFVILGTPFFLNGAVTSPLPAAYVAGFVIFFGGGAIIYLFLFNRRTRRSLHDLLCGTIVLSKAPAGHVQAPPIWRGHLAILSGLAITMLIGVIVMSRLAGSWKFPELLALRGKILATGQFTDAGVFIGRNWSMINGTRRDTAYLALTVRMKHRPPEFEPVARQIAALALNGYADSQRQDFIAVNVQYGYDIGIAQAWTNQQFQFSPAQWEQRIAARK